MILSEEFRDKVRGDKDAEQKLISDIQTHFKKVTAPYKAPRAIEFVDELPKTVSGKIRRVELRELEQKRKADVLKQQRAKL